MAFYIMEWLLSAMEFHGTVMLSEGKSKNVFTMVLNRRLNFLIHCKLHEQQNSSNSLDSVLF